MKRPIIKTNRRLTNKDIAWNFLNTYGLNIELDQAKVAQMTEQGNHINNIRHTASNYDVEIERLSGLAFSKKLTDNARNKVCEILKNQFNEKISSISNKVIAAKNEVIDAQAAEIAQLRALLAAQQAQQPTVKVVVQTREEIAANNYVKADGNYHW